MSMINPFLPPNLASTASTSAANGDEAYHNTRLKQLRMLYGEMRAHEALLQCMYEVKIEDIFNIGRGAPWFADKSLGYLVTEAELSLGSAEAESFYAGALQANYLTRKSEDEMDLTFIETIKGDIANSYRACHKLAFSDDGTVCEPKKYAFKLTVGLLNQKRPLDKPVISRSWLVGVKSGRATLSSSARSEIVKVDVTFQKLRPLFFSQ